MQNEKKESTESINKCAAVAVDLINDGRFIEEGDAKTYLENYFDELGVQTPDDPTHIYGHTFGLNNFRTLLYKIDIYNVDKVPDQQVHGIRVYYGKSERKYPEYAGKGLLRDVFFMPVLKNGDDLYKVTPFAPGDIILGEGRPCPNECELTFLNKKK